MSLTLDLPEEPKKPGCVITEGGGALFTGDLWKCSACGREKYPEVFTCPYGRKVPRLILPTNPWSSP